MPKHVTTTAEFRNMQVEDLQREIKAKRMSVAKMHMGIEMRSFKDTAQYQRERKELATMLTVLGEKKLSSAPAGEAKGKPLKTAAKSAKVPAPKAK